MPEITLNRIAAVYAELMQAEQALAERVEAVNAAKYNLTWGRMRALQDGLIVGKNADEREACEHKLLYELYRGVEDAEYPLARVKCEREVAAMLVEQLRTELRWLELTASTTAPR